MLEGKPKKTVSDNVVWIMNDRKSVRLIQKFAGTFYGLMLLAFTGFILWFALHDGANLKSIDLGLFILAGLFLWKALGLLKMAYAGFKLDWLEKKVGVKK